LLDQSGQLPDLLKKRLGIEVILANVVLVIAFLN